MSHSIAYRGDIVTSLSGESVAGGRVGRGIRLSADQPSRPGVAAERRMGRNRPGRRSTKLPDLTNCVIVEKLVENLCYYLEISGFLRTFAVRKKSGVSFLRC